jgi:hypothetical protein
MGYKIVVHDYNEGKGATEAVMLRLWFVQSSNVWAWECEVGKVGNGDKAGWLTFNDKLPWTAPQPKGSVQTVHFHQDHGRGGPAPPLPAFSLDVSGWPLNTSSEGYGDHINSGGGGFPGGRVHWKMNRVT